MVHIMYYYYYYGGIMKEFDWEWVAEPLAPRAGSKCRSVPLLNWTPHDSPGPPVYSE